MRRIYRYEVPVDGDPHVLTVSSYKPWPLRVEAVRADLVEFWLEADDGFPQMERAFIVVGTGHELPAGATLLGTAGRLPSGLVWHLCGIGEPSLVAVAP